jgi:hypothetical protein
VEFEPLDEFEQELHQALERRPAPPSLKGKIMARRRARPGKHTVLWQRLAASIVVAALLGGAVEWDQHVREERRRGEAARDQVMTALRITGHALDKMNRQLTAHDRAQE